MDLLKGLLKGDRRATARLITIIEDGSPASREVLKAIYPHTGKAHIVGVTGPGGVGKSCLVDKLTHHFRGLGKTVGVLAVDPSSPISGGAILGDRIRMQNHTGDEGVFIRSMGARGGLGGLSATTRDVVKVLDASGKEVVIVETAGAGQADAEIARIAHTVVVVLMPRMGDEIQALKSGILEIGDIFVVNKADLEGVEETMMLLQELVEYDAEKKWRVPVLKTVATTGEGVEELAARIQHHAFYLEDSKFLAKLVERGVEQEIIYNATQLLSQHLAERLRNAPQFRDLLNRVVARELDPQTAASDLVRKLLAKNPRKTR